MLWLRFAQHLNNSVMAYKTVFEIILSLNAPTIFINSKRNELTRQKFQTHRRKLIKLYPITR